jgi:hemerythrin
MPIIWRHQLTTGDERIDQDHKYLFAIFNCVELALSSPDQIRHLPLFFKQLFDYTEEHFLREEKLQFSIGYPGYLEHKIAHQRILERLKEVNDHLQAIAASESGLNDPEALRAGLDKEILDLARSWIVGHIAKMDTAMLPYLKQSHVGVKIKS